MDSAENYRSVSATLEPRVYEDFRRLVSLQRPRRSLAAQATYLLEEWVAQERHVLGAEDLATSAA
jgi:hypothetical protein